MAKKQKLCSNWVLPTISVFLLILLNQFGVNIITIGAYFLGIFITLLLVDTRRIIIEGDSKNGRKNN